MRRAESLEDALVNLSWPRTLLVAIGLMAAGCAGAPPPANTLVLAIPSEVRTLDPARGYDTYSVAVIHAIATGLLDYDEKTNLHPDLAASSSASGDRRRYAFTLRPGIRFSNGRPVTSRDFKYAIERVLDPATASPGAGFYQSIEGATAFREHRAKEVSGIRAPDDNEIVFHLSEPSA